MNFVLIIAIDYTEVIPNFKCRLALVSGIGYWVLGTLSLHQRSILSFFKKILNPISIMIKKLSRDLKTWNDSYLRSK